MQQITILVNEKQNIINQKVNILCEKKYDLDFKIQNNQMDIIKIKEYVKDSIKETLDLESKKASELSKISNESIKNDFLLLLVNKYTEQCIEYYA